MHAKSFIKRKKHRVSTIFFLMSSFYLSGYGVASCTVQDFQYPEKFINKGDLRKSIITMLDDLYKNSFFSEELYQGADDLLKQAVQNELEEMKQKGIKTPSEEAKYYLLQIKILREIWQQKRNERKRIFQEHYYYCTNDLLSKVVKEIVCDLCTEKMVSRTDLVSAYSLVCFIVEQETAEGNGAIMPLYKDLQKRLQDKGNAHAYESADRKMTSFNEPAAFENISVVLNEKIGNVYADYFFKKIVEGVNAFYSLELFSYKKELYEAISDLALLINEALEHEESMKRIICYNLLQDRMLEKCANMQQRSVAEQAIMINADVPDKQPSISKSKKKYRDKRKKNKAKK